MGGLWRGREQNREFERFVVQRSRTGWTRLLAAGTGHRTDGPYGDSLYADHARRAVLGSQQYWRGSKRDRRRAAVARFRRGAVLRPRFLFHQHRAAPEG